MNRDARKREDDWFRLNEKVLIESARHNREHRIELLNKQGDQVTLDNLRQTHWMKCPKCGHDMQPKKLHDIEIDHCTFCEGLYFDRGELEDLLLKKKSERFSFFRDFFGLD